MGTDSEGSYRSAASLGKGLAALWHEAEEGAVTCTVLMMLLCFQLHDDEQRTP